MGAPCGTLRGELSDGPKHRLCCACWPAALMLAFRIPPTLTAPQPLGQGWTLTRNLICKSQQCGFCLKCGYQNDDLPSRVLLRNKMLKDDRQELLDIIANDDTKERLEGAKCFINQLELQLQKKDAQIASLNSQLVNAAAVAKLQHAKIAEMEEIIQLDADAKEEAVKEMAQVEALPPLLPPPPVWAYFYPFWHRLRAEWLHSRQSTKSKRSPSLKRENGPGCSPFERRSWRRSSQRWKSE